MVRYNVMTNQIRMFKKLISIVLVLLLSIESFAAIVSDNDGSAFITKSEFEALKKDFQSQIENYNNSIEGKIDGAIAAYLAGIKTAKIESMDILTNDWTEISCFNGVWDPTFQYPDLSIIYAGGIANDFSWGSGNNKKFSMPFWRQYRYDRTNTNVNKSYRPLVTGNTETSQTTNMVWNGVANYYVETFESTLAFQTQGSGDLADVEVISGSQTLKFLNPCVYTMSGYVSGFAAKDDCLNATFKWRSTSAGYDNNISMENKSASNAAIVELKTDSNKITKTYEHIIQYKGDEEWSVSNEKFTKTFRAHSKNTLKSNAWMNATSRTGYNRMLIGHGNNYQSAGYYYNHYQRTFFYRTNMSWADTDDQNKIIPSIGMLASDQKASAIYQFEKDKAYQFGKNTFEVKKPKLHEGFPLFCAKEGVKCTWRPYFKKGKKQNTSGTWVDDGTTKVRLVLSVGPFEDAMTAADNSKIIKLKVNGSKEDVLVAKCEEEKYTTIEFEMPKDGIVYAKWCQDDDAYETNKWIKTIDLKKCNTWSYINNN